MGVFYIHLSDGEVIRYYKVKARTTTGQQVSTIVYAFTPEELFKKFHKLEEIEGIVFEGPRDHIYNHLFDLACQVEACLKAIAEKASDSTCEEYVNDMKDLLSLAREKLNKVEDLIEVIEHELYREESRKAVEEEQKRYQLQLEIARLKRELRELKKEKEEKELNKLMGE